MPARIIVEDWDTWYICNLRECKRNLLELIINSNYGLVILHLNSEILHIVFSLS